jgi:SAM-dependent methyltransferase
MPGTEPLHQDGRDVWPPKPPPWHPEQMTSKWIAFIDGRRGIASSMSKFKSKRAREFYAQTYDAVVSDWQGELDFYRSYASQAASTGRPILEIACGTGRVALRLTDYGVRVVGLDNSSAMLDVARTKSKGNPHVEWVESDMRSFDLGETFGLILIPGHAFQNLVEAADQVACLQCIHRHLDEDGTLIIHLDHQSLPWLGDLVRKKGGKFEAAEDFINPITRRPVYTRRAWSYEPATQTAVAQTVWEEIDEGGNCIERWESGPIRLHCVFRFEMEHLLALTGFRLEALYGSFLREQLEDESDGMVWVAKKARR